MRSSLRTTLAAAATAVLAAACGTSPMEPTAAAAGTRVNTGFSVGWGAKAAPTDPRMTGFSVGWGRGDSTATAGAHTGFSVGWGRGDSTATANPNAGFSVGWGRGGEGSEGGEGSN